MLAIKTGNLESVRLLLDAGANVNNAETFHNQTPLMWAAAAARNAAAMVDMLLAKGADVTARSQFNDWPSQISSEPRAQYRPVGGLTALLYAARDGCFECVRSLIRAGASVNTPSPEGVTPLMMAIDNDHNEVAKLLLENGAKPDLWDWYGRTALYIAVDRKNANARGGPGRGGQGPGVQEPPGNQVGERPSVSHLELITALLDRGVNANAELNMHRPSRGGNSGRFGESQRSTGATPLFRAVQSNDTEIIELLLAHGANPNIYAMGFTPFLLAAGVGPGGRGGAGGAAANQAVLDLMIKRGADVNAKVTGTESYTMRVSRAPSDNEGTSALHTAVQRGNADLVKYLLEHGADPNLLDADGRKPIDMIGIAPPAGPAGPGAGGRGGRGGQAGDPAEIRQLLEAAMAKR
jgi:ankyrin repeat protein